MKRLLLLSSFFLSLSAFGQNWRPFRPGAVPVFSGDAQGASNVAVGVAPGRARAAGDTVYPFLKAMTLSDCGTSPFNPSYARFPLSPFGKAVAYDGRRALLLIPDSSMAVVDSLALRTDRAVGQAYASGSFSVTYQGASVAWVRGVGMDSVRSYMVDGKPAVWSKQAGIVAMPTLLNAGYAFAGQWLSTHPWLDVYGVKGTALALTPVGGSTGPTVPTPDNLNPFQVGDSVSYHYIENYMWQANWWPNRETWKHTLFLERRDDPAAHQVIFKTVSWSFVYDRRSIPGSGIYRGDTAYNSGPDTATWTQTYSDSYLTGDLIRPINVLSGEYVYSMPKLVVGADTVLAAVTLQPGFGGDSGCFSPIVDAPFKVDSLVPYRGLVHSYSGGYEVIQDGIYTSRVHIYSHKLMTAARAQLTIPVRLKENPVGNRLEVVSPSVLKLTLLDLQGRTLVDGHGTELPVGHLPAGLYQLRVQDAQGRTGTLRVVKQ